MVSFMCHVPDGHQEIPPLSDQFIQAHYVREAGAGFALAASDVTTASVHDLVGRMVASDSPERANARRLARSYEQLGGARTAALRIEESAARRGEPTR